MAIQVASFIRAKALSGGCKEWTKRVAPYADLLSGLPIKRTHPFLRILQYDDDGNIIAENLYGNLTGKQDWFMRFNPQGRPVIDGSEKYGEKFTYSAKQLFAPLGEEDNGRKIMIAM